MKEYVHNTNGNKRCLIYKYDRVETKPEKHLTTDERMPNAQHDEKNERAYGILV